MIEYLQEKYFQNLSLISPEMISLNSNMMSFCLTYTEIDLITMKLYKVSWKVFTYFWGEGISTALPQENLLQKIYLHTFTLFLLFFKMI